MDEKKRRMIKEVKCETRDVLIHLYDKNDTGSLELLKDCRVNPDLGSLIRNDLEFYVP